MGNPYRKISIGDPYPRSATFHNKVVDVIRWYETQKTVSTAQRIMPTTTQNVIVDVKNCSGSDVSRFGVLGIDTIFPDPAYNAQRFAMGPVFHGVEPASPDHVGKFIVLLEGLKNGLIGKGVIAGQTVAKISVSSANHGYAEISDGSYMLASAAGGSAQILWKESGTGILWALIRMGIKMAVEPFLIRFQAAEASSAQEAFDIDNVSVLLPAGAVLSSTPTTVYNFHAWEIDNDAWGEAVWNESNSRWDVIQVDCPA